MIFLQLLLDCLLLYQLRVSSVLAVHGGPWAIIITCSPSSVVYKMMCIFNTLT